MSGAEHQIPRVNGLSIGRPDLGPQEYVGQVSRASCLKDWLSHIVHLSLPLAQGLDGDPVYLLDELLRYRFKLFQDGDGFFKLCAGR